MRKIFLFTAIFILAFSGLCGCKKDAPAENNQSVQEDVQKDDANKKDDVGKEDVDGENSGSNQEDLAPGKVTAESLLQSWGNKAVESAYIDLSMELELDYLVTTEWSRMGTNYIKEMVNVKETLDAKLGDGVFYFNRVASANNQGFPIDQVSELWIETDGERVRYTKFNPQDGYWYADDTWDTDIAAYLMNMKKVFTGLTSSVYTQMSMEESSDAYVVTAGVDLEKLLSLYPKEEEYKEEFFTKEFLEKYGVDLTVVCTFDKETCNLLSMSLEPNATTFACEEDDRSKEYMFNTFICKLNINELSDKEEEFPYSGYEEIGEKVREDKKGFLDDWYEMDIFEPNLDRVPRALKLTTPENYVEKTDEISKDWTSLEFFFDGRAHTLGDPVFTLTDTWSEYEEGDLDEVYSYSSSTLSFDKDFDHSLLHVGYFSPDSSDLPAKDRHIHSIAYEGDYRDIVDGVDTCDLQVGTFKIGGNFEEAKGDLGERNIYYSGGDLIYQYYSDYGRCALNVTVDNNIITGIRLYYSNWDY